jgi:hypothetical protein
MARCPPVRCSCCTSITSPATTSTYTDEHKAIADHGWWELVDRNERRFVFDLHGTAGTRRYALIDTGRGWLLHLTKQQLRGSDPD